MSTIQIGREWQPEPVKNLVKSSPVKEGAKLYRQYTKCIVCSGKKTPFIFDEKKEPLVLRCNRCGHKSWATGTKLLI
jgi:DNA-directed RNA polymerase subunit RPC12/RpoP